MQQPQPFYNRNTTKRCDTDYKAFSINSQDEQIFVKEEKR